MPLRKEEGKKRGSERKGDRSRVREGKWKAKDAAYATSGFFIHTRTQSALADLAIGCTILQCPKPAEWREGWVFLVPYRYPPPPPLPPEKRRGEREGGKREERQSESETRTNRKLRMPPMRLLVSSYTRAHTLLWLTWPSAVLFFSAQSRWSGEKAGYPFRDRRGTYACVHVRIIYLRVHAHIIYSCVHPYPSFPRMCVVWPYACLFSTVARMRAREYHFWMCM